MAVVDPPTKPPRGVKCARETSGLLMSIIRTLSTSESNEQRDEERTRLEKEYKKSNQQLEQLVSVHHDDLTVVMKLFGRLSFLVSHSRQKVHIVKDNLHACKKLLTCRREELQRLWSEAVEHKYTLQFLNEIEKMKEVPMHLTNHLSQKHYLDATNALVCAINLSKTTLKDVEALSELKSSLNVKKQELLEKLIKEMNTQIYVNATREIFQLHRQGSAREHHSEHTLSPLQRITERRLSIRLSGHGKTRRVLNFSSPGTNSRDVSARIEDDDHLDDPEYVISTLFECVTLLNKLQTTLQVLKQTAQRELLSLVSRTTRDMLPNDSKDVLVEFFRILIEQFNRVVSMHRYILEKYGLKISSSDTYNLSDIWSKIQCVMQYLLTDYLDIQNIRMKTERSTGTPAYLDNSDITTYFTRRKPARSSKEPLFRFKYSTCCTTDLKLHSNVSEFESGRPDKTLVCEPSPHNITLIFVPLTRFIDDIERATDCSPEKPCMLNTFINNFVREVFLGNHYSEVTTTVEAIIKSTDSWRAVTTLYQQQPLPRPLLVNTVKVTDVLNDVVDLMHTLPSHKDHFISLLKKVLHSYKDTCYAAYRGIVQPEPEDHKQMKSAVWLKDNEIKTHLKSFPNWLELKSCQNSVVGDGKKVDKQVPIRIVVQENEQKHIKEADMLITNIGENTISEKEFISDINQLKCLAQLQESVEWFCHCINDFADGIHVENKLSLANANSPVAITVQTTVPDSSNSTNNVAFRNLVNEFTELADTCLFILHLEVRAQCFYYLLPKSNSGTANFNSDMSLDPDPKVLELNKALSSIDEVLSLSLQPKKIKYIFDGVGSLVTKILLGWTRMMDRLDEILIHKLCRNIHMLQHTLSTITGIKETSLDRAKQYFQLFFLTPQEILNEVSEKGPSFSEFDYMNVFQLIHHYRQEFSEEGLLQMHLQKLSDVLGETNNAKA